MTYIQRQLNFMLAENVVELPEAVRFFWRFRGVEPRNILKLATGKWISGKESIAASDSYSLPFPTNYSAANRLAVFITADQPVSVSKNAGADIGRLFGTRGSLDGDHPGILAFQEALAAPIIITATLGAGLVTVVEFFMFEIPDLTIPASWRDGAQTIGVV